MIQLREKYMRTDLITQEPVVYYIYIDIKKIKVADYSTVTEKTWGRGWVVLVVNTLWIQNGRTFLSYHQEGIGELLGKNIAEQ